MRIFEALKLMVGSWVVLGACVATWGACGGSHSSGGLGGNGGKGAGGHGGMLPSANADEAGSRLKANIIKGTDGSKHYVGTFHDTQRNEDCSFKPAVDGKTRCLPDAAFTGPYFEDATCMNALVSVPSACVAPAYGAKAAACGLGQNIYKIGAKSTTTTPYVSAPGGCMAGTAPPNASLYTLGAEQAPTAFVEGTAATE
jgi:hypothetical protein